MSTAPVTLDFSKAQPAVTLDFSKAQSLDEEKPFLDRDIPLSSYGNATLSGIQSIGRGLRDAGRGIVNTVEHPIDTAKSIIAIPGQAAQIPAAIHDINQSVDPLGTYAKVAQDTAGQGAGQAILSAATEGLGKGIAAGAKPIARVVGKVATRVGDTLDPDLVGIASPRAANVLRTAQKVGRVTGKYGAEKPIFPAAPLPETPPQGSVGLGIGPRSLDVAPPQANALAGVPVAAPAPTIAPPAAAIAVRPGAPMPIEPQGAITKGYQARVGSPADVLETKGIQEQIRDAGEREDMLRLKDAGREQASRTMVSNPKGVRIAEANSARGVTVPEKPVKLTKTPGVSSAAPKVPPTPAGADLEDLLQKSLAAARKLKNQK